MFIHRRASSTTCGDTSMSARYALALPQRLLRLATVVDAIAMPIRTIRPLASRIGLPRSRCQRYCRPPPDAAEPLRSIRGPMRRSAATTSTSGSGDPGVWDRTRVSGFEPRYRTTIDWRKWSIRRRVSSNHLRRHLEAPGNAPRSPAAFRCVSAPRCRYWAKPLDDVSEFVATRSCDGARLSVRHAGLVQKGSRWPAVRHACSMASRSSG